MSLVRRYRHWGHLVQETKAVEELMNIEAEIAANFEAGHPRVFRQSDLSDCFTRLDDQLISELAVLFGMPEVHANMLFGLNHHRPVVVKAAGYASDWKEILRGLGQGDSQSPLGAALAAGLIADGCTTFARPWCSARTWMIVRLAAAPSPKSSRGPSSCRGSIG
jgi:hypothetical protein